MIVCNGKHLLISQLLQIQNELKWYSVMTGVGNYSLKDWEKGKYVRLACIDLIFSIFFFFFFLNEMPLSLVSKWERYVLHLQYVLGLVIHLGEKMLSFCCHRMSSLAEYAENVYFRWYILSAIVEVSMLKNYNYTMERYLTQPWKSTEASQEELKLWILETMIQKCIIYRGKDMCKYIKI